MAELQPGAVFAGHRIEGVAGRGGFGVVYRATHLALDHVVALKLISTGRAEDETFRDRFKSESRIAVSIRHPNVVAVHNAGEEDGLLFVTMDFIDGMDLRGLLNREGRLGPEAAVRIVSQVAAALDAAHERGLVHRDIKPGNVLIEERNGSQHVYLTDFGLSKQMDATSGVTASGAFVGTLDYVAPEQIKGDRLDARTDVYALGCVMFELLSGQVPFSQDEKVAKIYAHLQELPPELIDAAPEVPPALSEVVWRSMQKEPDARHPSAGDFARAAEAAVHGRAPTEPERNVGVGAAAPTQAYDVLAGAAAGAAADPETAEAAPPETVEAPPPAEPTTAESAPPEPPTEATPPARTTTRSTPRGALVAAGLAVIALAVGAFVLLGGGEETGGGSDGGGGGGGDGGGGGSAPAVEQVAEVAAEPVGVALDGDEVWVSSRNGQALTRLDAQSGEALGEPIQLAGEGEQVGIGQDGDVWVAVGGPSEAQAGTALHLDSEGKELGRPAVGAEPRGIAVGDNAVWVANLGSDTVSRIDLASDAVNISPTVGDQPARVAIGEKAVWVTNSVSNSVSRIRNEGKTVETVPEVGDNPRGIAVAAGLVWVASQSDNQVVRIDPDQLAVTGNAIDVGEEPRSLAADSDSLWVTNGGGTVSRIDLQSGEVEDTIRDVGASPEGIAVAEDGRIWVSSGAAAESDPGTVHVITP